MTTNFLRKFEAMQEAIETRTRADGSTFVCFKDDSSSWMLDAIHAAHGDRMPADDIYAICSDVIDAVVNAEAENADEAREALYELEADIYTADLLKWLSSNLSNVEYLSDAMNEYGTFDSGYALLAAAQKLHIEEVGNLLISEIEDNDDPLGLTVEQADEISSVSHGTMRPEDLIPAFMDVLETHHPEKHEELYDDFGDDVAEMSNEEQAELLELLFDALDEIAPDGYYFGAHPGDGSDYGFWEYES